MGMLQECIKKLVLGEDLSFQESYESMNEILDGKSSPVQNTAFLTALVCRKREEENITEITAFAKAMREHATEVKHEGMEVLEIVGTGGDHSNSRLGSSFFRGKGGKTWKQGSLLQVRHRRLSGSPGH